MRSQSLLAFALLSLAFAAPALAELPESSPSGPQWRDERKHRFQVGMKVTADGGPCGEIQGTIGFPTDWPEQEVRIDVEDMTPGASVEYRELAGGVKQMVIYISEVPAGEEAHALLTLEIVRRTSAAPADTSKLTIPEKKKLPRDMLTYLGNSPRIEATQPKIKTIAKEATIDLETDWNRVRALYDWTRANVEIMTNDMDKRPIGAANVIRNKKGDNEDLTNVFVALCRATGVPARIVWVTKHCYPEFYLQDENGEGHWFSCEMQGEALFGEIIDNRPILQKGENFKTPDRPREAQRFVAEHVTAKSAGGTPRVKFVRKLVDGGE